MASGMAIWMQLLVMLAVQSLTHSQQDKAGQAAEAGINKGIIGLIIGLIFLIIFIIISVIFVICRKQQERDYNVDKKETEAGLDPEKELKDKGFNDYSRPANDDYANYPDKKPPGDLEYDDVPIGGDDESLGESGDEDDTHFNEDGSFIGIYQKKAPPPPTSQTTENGDEDDTHFNEDGSFIGIYQKKAPPPPSQTTENGDEDDTHFNEDGFGIYQKKAPPPPPSQTTENGDEDDTL